MKRFRGLRGKQRTCFEQIATGRMVRHNPRTLAALEQKGLIETEVAHFLLDGFAGVVDLWLDIPYVPMAIHQEWCEWRAKYGRQTRRGLLDGVTVGTITAAGIGPSTAFGASVEDVQECAERVGKVLNGRPFIAAPRGRKPGRKPIGNPPKHD